MTDTLRFDWEWLAYPELPPPEAATFAELTIRLNDKPATRLYDVQAQTVRDGLFAAAYPLALFLAENWWRIRWEPAPEKCAMRAKPQWRLAHSIAAAGAGYVWPNITLYGDGEFVFVQVGPQGSQSSSVQFVSQHNGALPVEDFEAEVDRFMAGVLARLDARDLPDTELTHFWQEVQAERRDAEVSELRRLEAMAGYDPGEAPEEFLGALLGLERRLGASAIRELVAASRRKALGDLRALEDAIAARGIPYRVADSRRIEREYAERLSLVDGRQRLPWQRATEAARVARRVWGLGEGPVGNAALAEIMHIDADSLAPSLVDAVPYSAAFREYDEQWGRLVFRTGHGYGRRFASGRLVGDMFYNAGGDTLATATDARTSRQKFQRAFSQELLCPFESLRDFLDIAGNSEILEDDSIPNEDRIEESAEYFQVSTVLVQNILVNHNILPRDALSAI